jgi:hypothetical protein
MEVSATTPLIHLTCNSSTYILLDGYKAQIYRLDHIFYDACLRSGEILRLSRPLTSLIATTTFSIITIIILAFALLRILVILIRNDTREPKPEWILEVGFSELYEQLYKDTKLWLEGNLEVSKAVLVNFTEDHVTYVRSPLMTT